MKFKLLIASFILLSTSCKKEVEQTEDIETPLVGETLTDQDRIGLVWSDEFDGSTIDSQYWTYDLGDGTSEGIPGWGNNEAQFYTNKSKNSYLKNGLLYIDAYKESIGGKNYSSARIKTQSKFDLTYGKIKVRAKLPKKIGTWPAVWLLGASVSEIGWPACGEIDILEQTGQDKSKILGTTHWLNTQDNTNASYSKAYSTSGLTDTFKVYTLEWSADAIKIFVDNQMFYNMTLMEDMPFKDPFFIIINLAMGGTLGGDIDDGFYTDSLIVDYVRVYEL